MMCNKTRKGESKSQLIQFLKGNKSPNGRQLFNSWASMMEQKKTSPMEEEIDKSIKEFLDARINNFNVQDKPITISLTKKVIQVAASITILLTIGFSFKIITTSKQDTETIVKTVPLKSIYVPYGEKKTIQLCDGSTIHLNAGSELIYPEIFSSNKRVVKLKGEGFFEIEKNPDKPFIVQSGQITTQVLGTSFNVNAYSEENIEVTVKTGKVAVSAINKITLHLLPGEQANFNVGNNVLSKKMVDVKKHVGWRNDYLVFEDTPLQNVFNKLERIYNIKIQCEDKLLLQENIRSTYLNQDIDSILEDLKYIVGLGYYYNKNYKTVAITK